jgi:leucyl aminopeptidase
MKSRLLFGNVTIAVGDIAAVRKADSPRVAISDGVVLARDLVNEPANVLYPEEFARRVGALKKLRVAVEALDVKAMKKLGMNALLGVGQGSTRESRVVVMRWNGGRAGEAPVAFIGKGVCFDTGGISIKPASNMEDMKGDMAGAACVVGLMHALAARKARVNAVGLIGLVENMPDGNAQRPGDIVKSMSGQTIEIINTGCGGPARSCRRDLVRGAALQAEIYGGSGNPNGCDHRRTGTGVCRHVFEQRSACRALDESRK